MENKPMTTAGSETLTDQCLAVRQTLASAELFSGIASESLDVLAQSARRISLQTRELLVRSGETSRGIYLIESGMLKLACIAPHGSEKIVALLDAGKTFGAAELYSGRGFHYEIFAVRKARLLLLPGRVVRAVSGRDKALATNLLECLGRQFDALIRDIAGSAAFSAPQRVVSYLLARTDPPDDSPAELHLPVTKAALAARLGISPETMSRTLTTLESNGLIEVERRDITILDREALESMLHEDDHSSTA